MAKAVGRHRENRLSAAGVKALGAGFHADGQGLYLKVEQNGSRRWIQRLVIQGRRRDLGLGSPPLVSLKAARERALDNRRIARAGGDPVARPKAAPTFREASRSALRELAPTWSGARQADIWLRSMERDVFPALGARPVNEITSAEARAVLASIWHEKPETARKVARRVQAVFRHALGKEWVERDPSAGVTTTLPKHADRASHHKALPYSEVGAALAKIRDTQAWEGTRLALEFLILTAARSGEVRGARWAEIDLEAGDWTIPAERMKGRRKHRVPLSPQALDVLRKAEALKDDSGLVFPSQTGRDLSDNTLSKLLRENSVGSVPHGFRASFRQWAGEETQHPRDVIEHALAHVPDSRVEAAYLRDAPLMAKRRALMDEWAGYLTARSRAGNVVRLGA